MTVRIAVAGKGGAGKTTISATMARLGARRGHPTLLVDADSNPNAAVALGIGAEQAATLSGLPVTLASRRLDATRALTAELPEVVAAHGLAGPDGVTVIAMGNPQHADEGCLCSAHAVVAGVLADAADRGGLVIVDMEASPEHFSRGTVRHADVVVLVVEPYYRSLEAARRMAELAAELPVATIGVVANKVRDAEDRDAIADFCSRHDLRFEGWVPHSDDVLLADRQARSLLDVSPDSPVVSALDAVLERILAST